MIDSHCHLDHEPLISDLANVIQRSKNIGIEKLLTISTSIESFNRVKDIVIRGGENIACPEVEGAIYEHDDILEACVFGVPDERLGEILCAAIYLRENSKLSIDELQSFLSTKLAAFKIPVNIKFYENNLPRVGSGKFDKPNLREQFLENI